MNKNIRKIVALTVALSAVSTIVPSMEVSPLGITNVYAEGTTTNNTNTSKKDESKKDENTNKEVKSIEVSDSSRTLKLYDSSSCKSDEKVDNDDVKVGSIYYAKTTKKKISVDIDSSSSKYVRIFGDDCKSSTKGKKEGDSISLSSGTNTIRIRTYSEDKSDIRYDDSYLGEYKIKIKCQSSSSKHDDDDDDDKDNDEIYISDIYLSDGNIDFDKKKNNYDVKVPLSTKEITIKAVPVDDDDDDVKVTIDGSSVDEDDRWRRTVDLNEGKNKILIKVKDEDNDDKRTYTLNINRGNVEETSASVYLDNLYLGEKQLTLSENIKAYNYVVSNETEEIEIKAEPKDSDYTVLIDGEKVKDNDSYTKKVKVKDDIVNSYNVVVKNSSGTEQTYTINVAHKNVPTSKFPVINNGTTANRTTSTNTVTNNNSNNWVSLNGNWRYFDDKGNLVTNTWIYDQKDGQTYYVDGSGNMARGWLPIGNDWYYLGQDGAKKTGWQNDGHEWYYMDSTGKMLINADIGQYRVGPTGAWIH